MPPIGPLPNGFVCGRCGAGEEFEELARGIKKEDNYCRYCGADSSHFQATYVTCHPRTERYYDLRSSHPPSRIPNSVCLECGTNYGRFFGDGFCPRCGTRCHKEWDPDYGPGYPFLDVPIGPLANPEHVRLVRAGPQTVRRWRERYPHRRLNLRGINLKRAALREASLSDA